MTVRQFHLFLDDSFFLVAKVLVGGSVGFQETETILESWLDVFEVFEQYSGEIEGLVIK